LTSSISYAVRESPRAKYVRLHMSVGDGLIVVVPRRFDRSRIPDLLSRKKRWIENTFRKLEEERQFLETQPRETVPERISLRAIGEEWSVEYRASETDSVTAREHPGNRLLVSGAVADVRACRQCLVRWLSRKAHAHLVPWLTRLAGENGFQVEKTLVRFQKTRWGSCSRHKTISLNAHKLFLSGDLVEYVLLHELCHTIHLNHSEKFWMLVRQHVPDYREKRRQLRLAWRLVPAWTFAAQTKSR
jgi:predicted metal-dependent hydrolase